MGIEEEAEAWSELVDRQARRQRRLDVRESVGQGEGELLGCRRARLPDVVARDETGCHRGISAAQKRMTSVTRRTDGRGGKTYSFWAWYSFRMSFCSVPERSARSTPVRSATPTYMASTGAAGELMVMDVETRSQVDVGEEALHVGQRVDGDTGPTHFALGQRVVGVAPEQRRHVEGRRQAVTTGAQQLLEPFVGVRRRAEPGELAHGPQPGAVHGGVRPPGVGELPGQLRPLRPVHGLDGTPDIVSKRAARRGERSNPLPGSWSAMPSILLQCQSIFHSSPPEADLWRCPHRDARAKLCGMRALPPSTP